VTGGAISEAGARFAHLLVEGLEDASPHPLLDWGVRASDPRVFGLAAAFTHPLVFGFDVTSLFPELEPEGECEAIGVVGNRWFGRSTALLEPS
jgi:hypothetical protein